MNQTIKQFFEGNTGGSLNSLFIKLAKEKGYEIEYGDNWNYNSEERGIEVDTNFTNMLACLGAKMEPTLSYLDDKAKKLNGPFEEEIKIIGRKETYRGLVWLGHLESRRVSTLSLWLDLDKVQVAK
ncbi:hypothetical protein [Priestia aryabhattai]